jgi:hypothetical protein
MRIKVHCLAIVDRCTVPWAVLAADVKVGRGFDPVRYVLLPDDVRDGLSRLARDVGKEYAYYGRLVKIIGNNDAADGLPTLIRSHAFDSRGRVYDNAEGQAIYKRAGSWSNAEALWCRADVIGSAVLDDLREYRKANPRHKDQIWAPSWNAQIGAEAFALAIGKVIDAVGLVEVAS